MKVIIFLVCIAIVCAVAVTALAQEETSLSLTVTGPGVSAAEGETVSLTVTAAGLKEVEYLYYAIGFDQDIVRYEGIDLNGWDKLNVSVFKDVVIVVLRKPKDFEGDIVSVIDMVAVQSGSSPVNFRGCEFVNTDGSTAEYIITNSITVEVGSSVVYKWYADETFINEQYIESTADVDIKEIRITDNLIDIVFDNDPGVRINEVDKLLKGYYRDGSITIDDRIAELETEIENLKVLAVR